MFVIIEGAVFCNAIFIVMQTLTPIFSLNFAYNAKSNVMNRMKFFMFYCVPWKSGCCSPSRSQALFHSQAFPIRKRPRLFFSELLDVATGATDCYCEERRIVFGYFHPWNFSGKLIMGVPITFTCGLYNCHLFLHE